MTSGLPVTSALNFFNRCACRFLPVNQADVTSASIGRCQTSHNKHDVIRGVIRRSTFECKGAFQNIQSSLIWKRYFLPRQSHIIKSHIVNIGSVDMDLLPLKKKKSVKYG